MYYETKLTLTVDQEIIRKAKNHASKTSESLSSVIEEFLKRLSSKKKKHSVVDASRGLLKNKFTTISDKDIRSFQYKDKHGV